MAQMTDYLETELSNFLLDLNSGTFTAPGTLYLALLTADPTDTGSTASEVATGAYARETISFGVAVDGVSTTDADVTFTQATASWGTISHFGIMDAESAGNMLFHSNLNTAKTIETDDIFKVSSGNITVTLA